ncbi:AAA family ATPase [Tissierella creatinophila]|uniref:Iron-dicitrate transporter ATP-binding subunit n=1 Tax=Tissierella creatinophila DSM 6911 TaxID=1123403 RepID=A0A1U7M5P0_TISCR|nr:AAA family ATPase [Tissierella creatinophila]OLS02601.1 iron-dicitrate transporter ATP-binding subunit [Tissierella creatinophila DSM 6911]
MIYLDSFIFPDSEMEFEFFIDIKRTCYNSFYPFQVLSRNSFKNVEFEPITIFYGGNGSGKSTALNVIAEKLEMKRDSIFNKSNFFTDYVDMCTMNLSYTVPNVKRVITSDDVFDYILNIRSLNEGIDQRREEVFKEYLDLKQMKLQVKSLADYDELKKINKARRKTQSSFVRDELMDNVKGFSNGESAFLYFTEKIKENSLFLLDEPENSLSPKLQIELMKLIEDYAHFFNCQFVISTHSPFLLALKGAKIYNLDENPVQISNWTKLENVRVYYQFFKQYEESFDDHR